MQGRVLGFKCCMRQDFCTTNALVLAYDSVMADPAAATHDSVMADPAVATQAISLGFKYCSIMCLLQDPS